jgi:type II secretory pathway component PulK
MNEQSNGMKVLYAIFLLAVTARTIVALVDRFHKKDHQDKAKQ